MKTTSTGKLVQRETNVFECIVCGYAWFGLVVRGGRFPRGARQCPQGCRHDQPVTSTKHG